MREQRGQQLLTSSRGRLDYAISEPCAVSCWLNLPAFLENSLYCYLMVSPYHKEEATFAYCSWESIYNNKNRSLLKNKKLEELRIFKTFWFRKNEFGFP